jgi:hypothetical protein
MSTETVVKRILKSKEESQRIATLLSRQDDDFEWILTNLTSLKEKFANEYVAVRGGKVIVSDKDFSDLVEKLKEENIEINDVTVEYITAKPMKFLL